MPANLKQDADHWLGKIYVCVINAEYGGVSLHRIVLTSSPDVENTECSSL